MPTNITTAVAPITAIVVAALRDLGRRKAGTPLEIASTPVSAVHPEAKARRPSTSRPSPASEASPSTGTMPYAALEATGRCPAATRISPVTTISTMPAMNR